MAGEDGELRVHRGEDRRRGGPVESGQQRAGMEHPAQQPAADDLRAPGRAFGGLRHHRMAREPVEHRGLRHLARRRAAEGGEVVEPAEALQLGRRCLGQVGLGPGEGAALDQRAVEPQPAGHDRGAAAGMADGARLGAAQEAVGRALVQREAFVTRSFSRDPRLCPPISASGR